MRRTAWDKEVVTWWGTCMLAVLGFQEREKWPKKCRRRDDLYSSVCSIFVRVINTNQHAWCVCSPSLSSPWSWLFFLPGSRPEYRLLLHSIISSLERSFGYKNFTRQDSCILNRAWVYRRIIGLITNALPESKMIRGHGRQLEAVLYPRIQFLGQHRRGLRRGNPPITFTVCSNNWPSAEAFW